MGRLVRADYVDYWASKGNHVVNTQTNVIPMVIVFGATPNHMPLKYTCPIKKCNQVRDVYVT